MSLAELWSSSRAQLENKQVHQIIAFSGTGQLTDGGSAAAEFREYLGLLREVKPNSVAASDGVPQPAPTGARSP